MRRSFVWRCCKDFPVAGCGAVTPRKISIASPCCGYPPGWHTRERTDLPSRRIWSTKFSANVPYFASALNGGKTATKTFRDSSAPMSALNPDYSKRDCSLTPGCKDLIDVIQKGEKANWKTFFDSYWKLTYDTARKAGLTDDEAQEVIQELIIGVAQKTPNLGFDPTAGSFKAWVIHFTRWRISDKLRKKRGRNGGDSGR